MTLQALSQKGGEIVSRYPVCRLERLCR